MEYDFQIVFYTCSINSDIYKKSLGYRSNTVRNDYFNKGYYVCDHFGRPINVVNEENITIIFGEDFSRIFWSYLVKYLMQIWSINNSALFVKCAAFSTNKKGTILIGCGGSGKTMINTINEQISNFAQTYPTNLKASSNEALLFMRRYRFANCSCFSCCFKNAYPSSNVQ